MILFQLDVCIFIHSGNYSQNYYDICTLWTIASLLPIMDYHDKYIDYMLVVEYYIGKSGEKQYSNIFN